MAIWVAIASTVSKGQAVRWTVAAPPGLTIAGVFIPHMYSYGINDGTGYGGGLYWAGGSQGVATFDGETGWSSSYLGAPHFTWPAGGSSYFGWQVICGVSSCTAGLAPLHQLSVELLELDTHETTPPSITGTNSLWSASGWIRGDWPLGLSGDSPSGLCTLSASLGGQLIPGATFTFAHNSSFWHQCGSPGNWSPVGGASSAGPITVHTADSSYAQGQSSLTLSGSDAAGLGASANKVLYLDNQPVTLSLSGPTDAPSTAGTQYVGASAGAGPSGVGGISCSVDGSPYDFQPSPARQIAVQGVGEHTVSCYAQNRALNVAGTPATSPVQTWTLSIRQPSVSTVSFARVVDALRCASARGRVTIPARWVTGSYHGRPVRIKVPAETRVVTMVHCHPRIVVRRLRVNGRWRTVRTVLLPHTVWDTTLRIPYGAGSAVSGWLGSNEGNALGGQQVRILTAPDDGHQAFTQAAVATTAADGSWTAILPAGPSRLVRAIYDGTGAVEPSSSGAAQIIVPASVKLSISPHHTHWGRRISISGQLEGGYVPPAGKLVVLWIGWRGGSTEIGHLYAGADGRFRSTYTFLRGNGNERYRLWAATATESDYPYAAAGSRPSAVTVGP